MKLNKFLAIPLLLLAVSCSQEEMLAPSAEQTQSPITASSEMRSIDDAIRIAQQAADALSDKSRSSRQVVDRSKIRVIRSHNSRAASADTLLYAIDFEDNQGFALISAPANVEAVLALTEVGSFESEASKDNAGFQLALEATKAYVDAAARDAVIIRPPLTPTSYYDTIGENYKSPKKVRVNWNVRWPENAYFPCDNAGCGPVAMAQVFSAIQQPVSFTYTFEGRDKDSENVLWSLLNRHTLSTTIANTSDLFASSHIKNCAATEENHKTLGRIVRQMAELTQSTFSMDATITSMGNIYSVLSSLIPSRMKFTGSYYDCLRSGGLVIMSGASNSWGVDHNQFGPAIFEHIWVADGYWRQRMTINYYSMSDNVGGGYQLISSREENNDYIHINWGNAGECNGYFLDKVFAPRNAFEYDSTPTTSPVYNYCFDFDYINIL